MDKFVKKIILESLSDNNFEERIIFCISHAPAMMLFLREIFKRELVTGENDSVLERMGGIINPLDGFKIKVEKKKDIVELTYRFKNFERVMAFAV